MFMRQVYLVQKNFTIDGAIAQNIVLLYHVFRTALCCALTAISYWLSKPKLTLHVPHRPKHCCIDIIHIFSGMVTVERYIVCVKSLVAE